MYVIGLDVGTTGCKAAVFDEAGTCFGRSYEEFDICLLYTSRCV